MVYLKELVRKGSSVRVVFEGCAIEVIVCEGGIDGGESFEDSIRTMEGVWWFSAEE